MHPGPWSNRYDDAGHFYFRDLELTSSRSYKVKYYCEFFYLCYQVSLTSVFCKLMERIIVTEMLQYSKKHGLISNQQHGFLSKRSTATNLLESLDDWTCAFVNRNSAFIAYIDFKKAFDSVCHKKTFCQINVVRI